MWRVPAAISASLVAVVAIYTTLTGTDPESQESNNETIPQTSSTQDPDTFDNFEDLEDDDDEEAEGENKTKEPADVIRSPGWGFYADITPEQQQYSSPRTTKRQQLNNE
jgi:hypothetical protein